MNHVALFNGIGGFQLAAHWMGWHNLAHVENDSFCNRVVAHHFPESKQYEDIKEFAKSEAAQYRGRCDIITGGFPCQPFSHAGKRGGADDDRHLWPEMLETVRKIAPRYVVGENVPGILSWNGGMVFEEVCADLEAEGYEVQPLLLPAAGLGAPHKRERCWFVAHADRSDDRRAAREDEKAGGGERLPERDQVREPVEPGEVQRDASDPEEADGQRPGPARSGGGGTPGGRPHTDPLSEGCERGQQHGAPPAGEREQEPPGPAAELFEGPDWEQFPTQPPICGGDDGVPRGLDGVTFSKWRRESVKALGNAIVPQVALEIFKAIDKADGQ